MAALPRTSNAVFFAASAALAAALCSLTLVGRPVTTLPVALCSPQKP